MDCDTSVRCCCIIVLSVPTSSSIIPIQVQQKELEFQVIVTHPIADPADPRAAGRPAPATTYLLSKATAAKPQREQEEPFFAVAYVLNLPSNT